MPLPPPPPPEAFPATRLLATTSSSSSVRVLVTSALCARGKAGAAHVLAAGGLGRAGPQPLEPYSWMQRKSHLAGLDPRCVALCHFARHCACVSAEMWRSSGRSGGLSSRKNSLRREGRREGGREENASHLYLHKRAASVSAPDARDVSWSSRFVYASAPGQVRSGGGKPAYARPGQGANMGSASGS